MIFVVDSSGSINENDATNWDQTLSFIADVTSNLNIGLGADEVRVGIDLALNRKYLVLTACPKFVSLKHRYIDRHKLVKHCDKLKTNP